MRIVSLMAVAAAMVVAVPANAATYITTTKTVSSIGDQIGSTYDQLTFGGITGTITTPGVYAFSNLAFTAGLNSNTNHTDNGFFSYAVTLDAITHTFKLPYTIDINNSDTITLNAKSVTFGAHKFDFTPVSLTSGGDTVTGTLLANVSAVPEPATWAFMILGFGAVGGVMRRRSAVKTAVSFG